MTKGSLELVAHLRDQPIYTRRGRLYIGDMATSHTRVIGCAACQNEKTIIAVITRDKAVVVSELKEGVLHQLSRHECPKRVTRVLLTSEKVVVADAFGDVYALPIDKSIMLREEGRQEDDMILGHFSTVTDLALGDGLIASGDRDNKIRISKYPECYVIEGFCLGHEEFVTSLCWWGDGVVSGSGDGSVRMWDVSGGVVGVSKMGEMDIVKKRVKDDVVVGKIVICPWNCSKVVIGLVDCCVVYEMEVGIMEVKVCREFEGVVTGLEGGDDGILWVSTENKIYKVWEDGIEEMELAKDDGEEGEDSVECCRFVWLARQRKKEMVEDWKGKKRRFSDFNTS